MAALAPFDAQRRACYSGLSESGARFGSLALCLRGQPARLLVTLGDSVYTSFDDHRK